MKTSIVNRHTGLTLWLRETAESGDTLWDCENGESYILTQRQVNENLIASSEPSEPSETEVTEVKTYAICRICPFDKEPRYLTYAYSWSRSILSALKFDDIGTADDIISVNDYRGAQAIRLK